jgi:hypothetical protein
MSGRGGAAGCSTVTFNATEQCAFLLKMIRASVSLIERVYMMKVPLLFENKAVGTTKIELSVAVILRIVYPKAYGEDYPTGKLTENQIENINAILTVLKQPLLS